MDQRSNWPIWSVILVPDPEFALQHSYSNVLIARCRVLVRADNPEAPLPPLRATTLRQVQHKGKKDFLFCYFFEGPQSHILDRGLWILQYFYIQHSRLTFEWSTIQVLTVAQAAELQCSYGNLVIGTDEAEFFKFFFYWEPIKLCSSV